LTGTLTFEERWEKLSRDERVDLVAGWFARQYAEGLVDSGEPGWIIEMALREVGYTGRDYVRDVRRAQDENDWAPEQR